MSLIDTRTALQRFIDKHADQDIGWFFDFDGTLVPLSTNPEDIAVPAELVGDLKALQAHPHFHVAVVSGRSLANLSAHLPVPDTIALSGNHGMEYQYGGRIWCDQQAVRAETAIQSVSRDLQHLSDRFPQTVVEDKRYSLSIHYAFTDPQHIHQLEETIAQAITPYQEMVRTAPAKMCIEIRPRHGGHKGLAVRRLSHLWGWEAHRIIFPIVFGDDLTDEDAFSVARKNGLAVRVGGLTSSTQATLTVEDPSAVSAILHQFITRPFESAHSNPFA
ncbi:MAG: trehalose-phosphatase [Firmicutes bacterium]|nr:trehalose-phosphatase [Bacillota bacterium]